MKPTDPPPRKTTTSHTPREPGAHGHPEDLENPTVHHEHSDVAVRPIFVFVVGLAAVGIVVHVLMWIVFGLLERQAAGRDPELSPLARPATQMPARTTETPVFSVGTGPQLLTDEPGFLLELRRREDQRLRLHGWVDEQAGIAHIPIGEAKRLLVERGQLPARTNGEADPRLGTDAPARGGPASGRTITMSPEEAIRLPAARGQEQLDEKGTAPRGQGADTGHQGTGRGARERD